MNTIFLWFLTTFVALGIGYMLGARMEEKK